LFPCEALFELEVAEESITDAFFLVLRTAFKALLILS